MKLERNREGKILIHPNTNKKESDRFYRQGEKGLYFQLAAGEYMTDGLMASLEAAKQERCAVFYDTACSGLVRITPLMNRRDALNCFSAHLLSKQRKYFPAQPETNQESCAKSISFEDFYFAKQEQDNSRRDKIINFCEATGIDVGILAMCYDMPLRHMQMNNIPFDQMEEVLKSYDLPGIISVKNLPKIKKNLVLSADDPRVEKVATREGKSDISDVLANKKLGTVKCTPATKRTPRGGQGE